MLRTILFNRRLRIVALCVCCPGLFTYLGVRTGTAASKSAEELNIGGLYVNHAIIDLGTVWSGGQSIQREFELRNDTGHAISIESVTTDCGCTLARAVSNDVPIGQSTMIPILFWPPAVANDLGGRFQRTISVDVTTYSGHQKLMLFVTGFVAPDRSLRVSPSVLEIDENTLSPEAPQILHFKGETTLLSSIPGKLIVRPGQDQRIIIKQSNVNESISTKDVKIVVIDDRLSNFDSEWSSLIKFALDSSSDGLTVRIQGTSRLQIRANPRSLLLSDDVSGREGIVRLTGNAATFWSKLSIETKLPLICQLLGPSSDDNKCRTLRVRIARAVTNNLMGEIRIKVSDKAEDIITIPVVILHYSSAQKPTP